MRGREGLQISKISKFKVTYICLSRRNGSSIASNVQPENQLSVGKGNNFAENGKLQPNGTKITLLFGNVPSIAFRSVPSTKRRWRKALQLDPNSVVSKHEFGRTNSNKLQKDANVKACKYNNRFYLPLMDEKFFRALKLLMGLKIAKSDFAARTCIATATFHCLDML
uniref:Uncharacterized protein n=1 Tax=Romanomermis culicivorax TaxID=13658 RepID=A0A915KEC5_ROMCU